MSDHCGNPQLRDWVKEWMDQASTLQSKSYFTYKKAYESLCKCPVEFSHPSEAARLNGIGPGLVGRLTKNLAAYCKENGLPMPENPGKAKKKTNTGSDDSENAPTPVKKRVSKPYIPKYRTGGYGIMLCLLEYHSVGLENIVRDQICRTAQKDCDASYTLAEPGKSYTAWNSITALLEKGYVWKNGSPAKYSLTDTGLEMAKKLKNTSLLRESNGSGSGTSSPSSSSRATSRSTGNASDASMLKNVSTARGKKARGSTTSDILDRMIDFDAPNDELDMSLYVSNPSEHQSISINGRTSNNNTTASRSKETPSEDILQALADASRPKKRQRATSTKTTNKRQKQANKSTTAAYLEDLLARYDNQSSELGMSMYVTNPSEHQSISLGGRTVHNKPTTLALSTSTSTPKSSGSSTAKGPSRPSTASSITNSNNSSFARRVMNASDNNTYDDRDYGSPTPSSSRYSTPASSTILQADKAKKYTIPSSSVLLKNNKTNINKSSKPAYNVDEYEIDLTPSSLPKFKQSSVSSQLKIGSDEIVDLLSSPEPSPTLQPTALDDDITFNANFDPEKDYFPLSQSRTKQINEETFHYTYLDTEKKEVRHLSKAAVIVVEKDQCLAYHIRFFSKQSDHPKFKYLVRVSEDEDHRGCSTGYITEMHKDAISPGLPAKPILPLHREEPDDFWPNKEVISSQTSLRNDYNERLFSSQASSQPSSSQLISSSQPISPQQQSQTQTQQYEVNYTQLIESEPLESMLPHEYEIVLVLDSREIQMKGDRDYFQRKLAEKGVKYVTRSMDLGDVIWIAQRKGNTNQSEELFLDYIVERKRLDDLVSSIKDGRFIEQKTRLKRSGAAKVIYVVEEYNREDAINFGLQAIQTAMSSTQIIDGIYLKRTNSVDETIEYLVSATKLVERIYKDTTLYSIPGHIITRRNYLDLKGAYNEKTKSDAMEKCAYLITYPMYGQLNTKNGSTTLHEVYLRMLMTIRGVNAERALSLIKTYPTPHALLKAFDGKTVEEAKTLVKDATQHHISRRRWGVQISERLFQIWGAAKYPPPAEDDD